jgi:hypothetical protein
MHDPIILLIHKRVGLLWRGGSYDVDLGGKGVAEVVEGEVVDVVAEGVFDFVADGGEA